MKLKNKVLATAFVALLVFCSHAGCGAQDVVESKNEFSDTMIAVQEALIARGYTVSRIQPIDEGMAKAGYDIEKYRVVFFGKSDEVDMVLEHYPQFSLFLPLSLVIYEEEGKTKLVSMPFNLLENAAPTPEVAEVVAKWRSDIQAVIHAAAEEQEPW